MKFSRHIRILTVLLLAGVWITTASWAEHISAQFILCQPSKSPCCPPPATSGESCPACHLPTNTAVRESRRQEHEQKQQKAVLRRRSPIFPQANPQVSASRRALIPGFRYKPRVFDLKDDLRV